VVPLFGVGWTLNFEMFFYALFALALLGPRWTVVPGVIAVLTAMVITNALGLPAPPWLKFLSDPIVLEFAFGMLVALAYRRNVALPVWLRALMIVTGANRGLVLGSHHAALALARDPVGIAGGHGRSGRRARPATAGQQAHAADDDDARRCILFDLPVTWPRGSGADAPVGRI